MINREMLPTVAALMLVLILSNCSEEDCVCPAPGDPPRIIMTYPQPDSVNVPTDTFLTVVFDKLMDPATISSGSFTLSGPGGQVSASVAFDSQSTVTLTPFERLAGHSLFTARIDPGVRARNGTTLGAPYAWSFRSGTTRLFLYPDIEFTLRDQDGDGNPDEMPGGGPPGRFLQAGVNGLQADRAVMEFPLNQIVRDEVLEAVALVNISAIVIPGGVARIESWGYIGNGTGELADWDNGSLSLGVDDVELNAGNTFGFPIIDFINAALDSSASHVGLRIVITGGPVAQLATSGGMTDDDKPRILVLY